MGKLKVYIDAVETGDLSIQKTRVTKGTSNMIQDIAPHILNNAFHPKEKPDEQDYVFLRRDNGDFLLKLDAEKETMEFPRVGQLRPCAVPDTEIREGRVCSNELLYLFDLDETTFYACSVRTDQEAADLLRNGEGYAFYPFAVTRTKQYEPKWQVFALYTAVHLMNWYEENRYCGRCGSPLELDTEERAMVCRACQRKVYPRINPAVIVGIINGNRLLITRYRGKRNMNALVAGFTEIGETLEETVQREVMEETGLKVKNIRYYKSQPWGIAADILAGFYCEVEGSDEIHMDESELKFAEWVEADEIELQPQPYSLTNEMMQMFKEGRIRLQNLHTLSER